MGELEGPRREDGTRSATEDVIADLAAAADRLRAQVEANAMAEPAAPEPRTDGRSPAHELAAELAKREAHLHVVVERSDEDASPSEDLLAAEIAAATEPPALEGEAQAALAADAVPGSAPLDAEQLLAELARLEAEN